MCAFCGAETVTVHRFTDGLQYLELDEAMALSERQECPFEDEVWHREVEMLEAAASEAVGTDLKRRLWNRIVSIIAAHYEEVASHNKELDMDFGF